jgi:hypothetical protein
MNIDEIIERERKYSSAATTIERTFQFNEPELRALLNEAVEPYLQIAFAKGAMFNAPCFVCGYNGSGYFDPKSHPCATKHHAAIAAAEGK